MATKGPISTAAKRIEGDNTGATPSGRGYPAQAVDLSTVLASDGVVTQATLPYPTHGLSRGSVILVAATPGTAVVDIEGSIDGTTWTPMNPRVRLDTNTLSEFDFDIAPFSHIRAKMVTADGSASDDAFIKFYAFNR